MTNFSEVRGIVHDIIGISDPVFNEKSGNTIVTVTVREAGDAFATPFKHPLFYADELSANALINSKPKTICLAKIRVATPEPFNRAWREDGNNHVAGELVQGLGVAGVMEPIVYTDLPVTVRCNMKTREVVGSENPYNLMVSSWRRGVNDGTIQPLGAADDDQFGDAVDEVIDEAPPVATAPVNRPPVGQQQRR